jgi:hypothetical protein
VTGRAVALAAVLRVRAAALAGAAAVVVLVACGREAGGGGPTADRATATALEGRLARLETAVAAGPAATPAPAPAVALAVAWEVAVDAAELVAADPGAPAAGAPLLAVHLRVTNRTLAPLDRFPWWRLRLVDAGGRTYSPVQGATATYLDRHPALGPGEGEDWQPGLAYGAAAVFAVPAEAAGLVLVAADGGLRVPLPGAGAATPGPGA